MSNAFWEKTFRTLLRKIILCVCDWENQCLGQTNGPKAARHFWDTWPHTPSLASLCEKCSFSISRAEIVVLHNDSHSAI